MGFGPKWELGVERGRRGSCPLFWQVTPVEAHWRQSLRTLAAFAHPLAQLPQMLNVCWLHSLSVCVPHQRAGESPLSFSYLLESTANSLVFLICAALSTCL